MVVVDQTKFITIGRMHGLPAAYRVGKLQACYHGRVKMSPLEFNKRLSRLVNYNNIGPEMYLSISSIIIVVWHLQMGNKLSQNTLRSLAPVSYKENLILYQRSKKRDMNIVVNLCDF